PPAVNVTSINTVPSILALRASPVYLGLGLSRISTAFLRARVVAIIFSGAGALAGWRSKEVFAVLPCITRAVASRWDENRPVWTMPDGTAGSAFGAWSNPVRVMEAADDASFETTRFAR